MLERQTNDPEHILSTNPAIVANPLQLSSGTAEYAKKEGINGVVFRFTVRPSIELLDKVGNMTLTEDFTINVMTDGAEVAQFDQSIEIINPVTSNPTLTISGNTSAQGFATDALKLDFMVESAHFVT